MSMTVRKPGRRSARSAGALVLASALAGCGLLDTERKIEKPPPTLVEAQGRTVTVDLDRSGDPVDLRPDQQLLVRLRLAGGSQADWTLVDFQPGVLSAVAGTRFEQDHTAAQYGEIAGTQSWRFDPARPGQATLRFELRVPRSREPALAVATYVVTVR